ncbi:MAG: hypothetical protein ABEJ95_05500 [Candidatus Nanohalobium sp.]
MSDKEVEETKSGVKKEGDWEEISEFAENVKESMEKSSLNQ